MLPIFLIFGRERAIPRQGREESAPDFEDEPTGVLDTVYFDREITERNFNSPEEAFDEVRRSFERWLTAHGVTFGEYIAESRKAMELSGPAVLLHDKLEAFKRAYEQDPKNLGAALERFESTVEGLRIDIRHRQRELIVSRKEDKQQREWRTRILDVLAQGRISGNLSGDDIAKVHEVLSKGLTASRDDTERRIQATADLLQTGVGLLSTLRPIAREIKERMEGSVPLEQRLADLRERRREMAERIEAMPIPREKDYPTDFAKMNSIYNRQVRSLLGAIEWLSAEIARLEGQTLPEEDMPTGKVRHKKRVAVREQRPGAMQ